MCIEIITEDKQDKWLGGREKGKGGKAEGWQGTIIVHNNNTY